jgi:hypothetical protein
MAGIIVTETPTSFRVEFNDYDIDIKTAAYSKQSISSIRLQKANDIFISLKSGEIYKIPLVFFDDFIDQNAVSIRPNGLPLHIVNQDGSITWNMQLMDIVGWLWAKCGL